MQKKCGKMCSVATVGWVLVIIGALNWGLIGLGYFFSANWNVVGMIFGRIPWLAALVYILVGVGGIMMLVGCKCKTCRMCESDMKAEGVTTGENK